MITYHKNVPVPAEMRDMDSGMIPHKILNKDLQDYLLENKLMQAHYLFSQNYYYFFLYLGNGARIDFQLN